MSRVEDAGLNASAPPQQRWLDGWLVRYLPGKARRARCINAVAQGRLPLDHKLKMVEDVYRQAGLPLLFRLTHFTCPPSLDEELAARGYGLVDSTRVMICARLPQPRRLDPPPGTHWVMLDADSFSQAVGALRASAPEHISSHALRLRHSPVPYIGHALRREADGAILACGQQAGEAELVGLYDVFTLESVRGQGLASLLCEHMLSTSALMGAKTAYLQVESENQAALRVYHRLGFVDAYRYHYREAPKA